MSRPKRNITPEQSAQIEALAAHGHTQKEIAYFLKIPYRTFQTYLAEDSLLMASWRIGRFKGKEYVLSRLMRFIKNDDLNAVNLNAIQFYLRNTGFGEVNHTDNKPKLKFPENKSPSDIIDTALTALEQGEITFTEAQNLANLAMTKLNVSKLNDNTEEAVKERESMEELMDKAYTIRKVLEHQEKMNKGN
jgi:hypothetical protein